MYRMGAREIFKWQKVLSLVVLSSIAIVTPVQASTLQELLSQYQQQYGQQKDQYTQQKQQESDVNNRIIGLQQSISTLNNSLVYDKENIAKQQKEIDDLNTKQQELDTKRKKQVKELSGYLRSDYEEGPYTYIGFFLGANSWSDLLNKVDQVYFITKRYNQLQDDIKSLSKQFEGQKADLQKKTVALQEQVKEKEATQASVQLSMSKEQQLLSQVSEQEKATLTTTSKTQSQIAYVQEMIRQQEIDAENAKKKPITSPGISGPKITTPVPLKGNVSDLIFFAESFIGTPYLWGGTTPAGFDCSGYTQYVFNHFGISLPRISQDQFQVGISVSTSDLQPGDLVFFSTYAPGASHVGIYVGNGNMVDAQGHGVMVTDIFTNAYWGPRYIGAQRVIK